MTDKLDLIKNSDEKSIEDMELGLLLSTAFYSFTQYLNEYFEEAGLTLTQARILFTLGIKDNVSVDYLAEKTYSNKSIVTKSIKVLEQKGFAKKQINPLDNRKKLITITDEGRKVQLKSQQIDLKINEELKEQYGLNELILFKKYLKKFILILNE